jgi:cyclic beta-1,2-glucan synthetase
VRAIENGLKFGAHGLPLMGCGDWNDGMNRVGHRRSRGESVWLAFFPVRCADAVCGPGPLARTDRLRRTLPPQAQTLRDNLERHAWDGDWYLRAWFDHGDTLGSHRNAECQIDALPQSWSVISGAGDPVRSRQAMRSVDRRLVRRDAA